MTTTRPDPGLLLPPDVLEHWRSKIAAVAGEPSAQLFADAMVRTLSRTLHVLEDGTVFVITGDIPAMWLRDSATQMLPYLRIAQDSPDGPLADLLIGIVRRQLDLPTPRPVRQRLQHRGQRALPRAAGPGRRPLAVGAQVRDRLALLPLPAGASGLVGDRAERSSRRHLRRGRPRGGGDARAGDGPRGAVGLPLRPTRHGAHRHPDPGRPGHPGRTDRDDLGRLPPQ